MCLLEEEIISLPLPQGSLFFSNAKIILRSQLKAFPMIFLFYGNLTMIITLIDHLTQLFILLILEMAILGWINTLKIKRINIITINLKDNC